MAKVLTSISRDAPAAPVTAVVNDTFAFSGTPSFTGTGSVQRYDFKWQVDSGGGYVTIAASGTGLITSGTNPVINTNSTLQQSITVSCNATGSYTIRMVGAPTSGGSYTVLSATQTVTVTNPVSVAISTVLGTGAVGSVGKTISRAITGEVGTGAVGTVVGAAQFAVAITGEQVTGSVGSLVESISLALAGNLSTGGVGTLVPGAGFMVAITGEQSTGAVGTFGSSMSLALAGLEASGAIESLVPSFSLALSGNAGLSDVGNLSVGGAGSTVNFFVAGVTLHQGVSRPTVTLTDAGGGTYSITKDYKQHDFKGDSVSREVYTIDGSLP